MKKTILLSIIVIFGILIMHTDSKAQEQYDIKIRPFSFLTGDFKASGEYLASNRISYEVNLAYRGGRGIVYGENVGFNAQTGAGTTIEGIYQERGIDIGVGARYYFLPKTKADRFYINPYVNLISSTLSQDDVSLFRNTQLVTGGVLGYKKVYKSGFFFECATGLGWATYYKNSVVEGSNMDLTELNPLKIKLPSRLAIGLRF